MGEDADEVGAETDAAAYIIRAQRADQEEVEAEREGRKIGKGDKTPEDRRECGGEVVGKNGGRHVLRFSGRAEAGAVDRLLKDAHDVVGQLWKEPRGGKADERKERCDDGGAARLLAVAALPRLGKCAPEVGA